MFDEYFNPPTIDVSSVPVANAQRAVDIVDSHVATSIDQDAPSTSIPSTQEQEHSQIISQDTPMVEKNKLDEDLHGTPVDATLYRGMIGSLMYLTSCRPNLIYAVCLCARYQAKATEKHLHAVKKIFRCLKGTINMGLWYSKDNDMSLTAYSKADHVGCQDTRRNTSGSAKFLGASGEWNSGTILCSYGISLADIFTKPLPRERFKFGMRSMSLKTLKRLIKEEDE
nr:hypothetical protein [Tanacetum cinerariifolium]